MHTDTGKLFPGTCRSTRVAEPRSPEDVRLARRSQPSCDSPCYSLREGRPSPSCWTKNRLLKFSIHSGPVKPRTKAAGARTASRGERAEGQASRGTGDERRGSRTWPIRASQRCVCTPAAESNTAEKTCADRINSSDASGRKPPSGYETLLWTTRTAGAGRQGLREGGGSCRRIPLPPSDPHPPERPTERPTRAELARRRDKRGSRAGGRGEDASRVTSRPPGTRTPICL